MPKWTNFQEGTMEGTNLLETREAAIAEMQKRTGMSFAKAIMSVDQLIGDELAMNRVFLNNRYQVYMREVGSPFGEENGPMVWLSIKRLDRQPIHDWRDLQRIKNEIVGVECEGVELYPAESRKVDQSNQFHMFVFKVPGKRFPFGFSFREVGQSTMGASKQRPFRESR